MTIEEELNDYIRKRAIDSKESLAFLGCAWGTPDFIYIEALWTKQFYRKQVEDLDYEVDVLKQRVGDL